MQKDQMQFFMKTTNDAVTGTNKKPMGAAAFATGGPMSPNNMMMSGMGPMSPMVGLPGTMMSPMGGMGSPMNFPVGAAGNPSSSMAATQHMPMGTSAYTPHAAAMNVLPSSSPYSSAAPAGFGFGSSNRFDMPTLDPMPDASTSSFEKFINTQDKQAAVVRGPKEIVRSHPSLLFGIPVFFS